MRTPKSLIVVSGRAKEGGGSEAITNSMVFALKVLVCGLQYNRISLSRMLSMRHWMEPWSDKNWRIILIGKPISASLGPIKLASYDGWALKTKVKLVLYD